MPENPRSRASEIDAHIEAFRSSFPDVIREQKHSHRNSIRQIKQIQKHVHSDNPPKNIVVQAEELYQISTQAQDNAIAHYRKFQAAEAAGNVSTKLRQDTIDAFAHALQSAHDACDFQIRNMFLSSPDETEKRASYRRIARMLDETGDDLHKLKKLTGEFYFDAIKANEKAQILFRSTIVDELANARKAERPHSFNPPGSKEVLDEDRRDRNDIVSITLLMRIKNINPRVGHVVDVNAAHGGTIAKNDLLAKYTNNRTYNCTRVVPATVGALFGGRIKASGAHDDRKADIPARTDWEIAYTSVYGGSFKSVDNLHQLFDALENSEDECLGILVHGYTGKKDAHATVAGKIGGVPCIVEAQNASVIIRDPYTNRFYRRNVRAQGETYNFDSSEFDPNSICNLLFLPVEPTTKETEFNRSHKVTDELFRNVNSDTGLDDITRPIRPKPPSPFEPGDDDAGRGLAPLGR